MIRIARNSLWLVIIALAGGESPAEERKPIVLKLWDGDPPGLVKHAGAEKLFPQWPGTVGNVSVPTLAVYLPPPGKSTGVALIYCSGGSYNKVSAMSDDVGNADYFAAKGVALIVLKYRTSPPSPDFSAALDDARRAVRTVRHRAREWNINPHKIGMLGGSAGGHLILTLATNWDGGDQQAVDPIARESCRPDFVTLLCPWPNRQPVSDFPITRGTPPALVCTARDDTVAPTAFAEGIVAACHQAGVKSRLWAIDTGGHGAFSNMTTAAGAAWVDQFWLWLEDTGVWNTPADAPPLDFQIEVTTPRKGYDGKTCWVHARAGAIPVGTRANPGTHPIVVLTMQKLDVTGSDVFFGLHDLRTDDLGKTWFGPKAHDTLSRRDYPKGGEIVISDHWPRWHAKTGTLLGIGHTVRYVDGHVDWRQNPRSTAYTVYEPTTREWTAWRPLEVPPNTTLASSGAGSVQRVDLPNGDILLPVYTNGVKDGQPTNDGSLVVRCRFDGTTLSYVEHGNELTHDAGRGFSEPSLAKFGDWFYLTLRNDDFAAVTRSQDGLHYQQPKRWTFDDGQDLGSYNTQAHWVTHSDGLFLVYTRKGANNDHVFRHRAPLFIARVDPERMVILRDTERVLVPERGARLGNFGVTTVSEHETWVTVTEWMQTWGPNYILPVDNKYGADNSLYVSKIRWSKPNKLAPE